MEELRGEVVIFLNPKSGTDDLVVKDDIAKIGTAVGREENKLARPSDRPTVDELIALELFAARFVIVNRLARRHRQHPHKRDDAAELLRVGVIIPLRILSDVKTDEFAGPREAVADLKQVGRPVQVRTEPIPKRICARVSAEHGRQRLDRG